MFPIADHATRTEGAPEHLIEAWGISPVVGGLFITAPMSVVSEAFATWMVVRTGQQTTAGTEMIADNAVTLTLALNALYVAYVALMVLVVL